MKPAPRTALWAGAPTANVLLIAAHAAGAAAPLYLQANPGASPATARDALFNNATTGRATDPGAGSPNRLLYTLFF